MLYPIVRPIARPLVRSGVGKVRIGGILLPSSTNRIAWFRKGIGITQVANAVSEWADQNGTSRHLLQATGANQPNVQGDGTVLFNGSSGYLKCAAFTLNQPYTVYLRIKQVSWVMSSRLFDGNAVNSGLLQQHGTTPGLKAYAGADSAQNDDLAVGVWGSVCVVFNGASSVIQVGAGAAVTSNAGGSAAGGWTLGASAGGSLFSNIQVAEAILYAGADDAAQRATGIAYLNTL